MGEIAFSVIWLVCTIMIMVLYHMIFTVYYFNAQGCLTEFVICGFLGGVIAAFGLAFILEHWKLILGIVLVVIALKKF